MRINPFVFGVMVLAVFMSTIGIFQAAGIWSTSGKVTASGEAVQPSADDVETIKGWMTLEQIIITYRVSLPDLLAQFELPAGTPVTTAIKDLENDLFSVTNLRAWLLSRMSSTENAAPGSSENQDVQPSPTAGVATATPVPDIAIVPTEHTAPQMTVTGKTTFQNLLDWGVAKDDIQNVIGGELPAPEMIIKDYVTSNSLDFATVKAALQALADQLK